MQICPLSTSIAKNGATHTFGTSCFFFSPVPDNTHHLDLRASGRGVHGGSSGGTWSKSSAQCVRSARTPPSGPFLPGFGGGERRTSKGTLSMGAAGNFDVMEPFGMQPARTGRANGVKQPRRRSSLSISAVPLAFAPRPATSTDRHTHMLEMGQPMGPLVLAACH